MLRVSVLPPVVRKTVSVKFSQPVEAKRRAILLGASGEQLQTYPLTEEDNELSLDGYAAGAYTLRVEAGSEVLVEQIIIP